MTKRMRNNSPISMNQYDKILEVARRRPRQGFTYQDLHLICNWPHKRVGELKDKGYKFISQWESKNKTRYLRFWLVGEPGKAA